MQFEAAQLSRPGSENGGDNLGAQASTEALVFSGDRLFWSFEYAFSLPPLDDEVAVKQGPTKRPAGQRSLDELLSYVTCL